MALTTGLDGTGALVRAASSSPWGQLLAQNVGTVAVSIYFNADGTGDPAFWLAGGTANNDGTGGSLVYTGYNGAVWAKTATSGGRLLAI